MQDRQPGVMHDGGRMRAASTTHRPTVTTAGAMVARIALVLAAALAIPGQALTQPVPRALDMLDASSLEIGDPGIEASAEMRRHSSLRSASRALVRSTRPDDLRLVRLAIVEEIEYVAAVGVRQTDADPQPFSALVATVSPNGPAWILFDIAAPKSLAVVGQAEYHPSPAGPLLRLPVSLPGTGALHHDFLFVWHAGRLQEIDAVDWLRRLRLGPLGVPVGGGIWKGVRIDPTDFSARTSIWLEGDANCCPSGGTIEVQLRLHRRRLVTERASYRPRPSN